MHVEFFSGLHGASSSKKNQFIIRYRMIVYFHWDLSRCVAGNFLLF